MLDGAIVDQDKFLSTLSVRRATCHPYHTKRVILISIHALREESDEKRLSAIYSRAISIHALREESDSKI